MTQLAEQNKIMETIEQQTVQSKMLRANISKQIATLTVYRKSLIHECVTGQRRITESDVRLAGE